MLRIRQKQIEELQRAAQRRLERYLVHRLLEVDPARFKSVGPERALTLVQASCKRAARFKIDDNRDVETFVLCDFLRDTPFELRANAAWARRLLADETISAGAKMEMVKRHLLEPALAEAKQRNPA